jgi:large subunit ribosomal protein L4
MALAAKVRDDELLVIDDLAFTEPRTKEMASILKHLDVERGQSVLVTTAKHDANVYRSARNIDGVSVSPAGDLNAHAVLSSRRLLVTKAALDALVASAKSATAGAAAKGPEA